MQKRSQKLQSFQDKKKQCQKDMAKCVGDRDKTKNEIQERLVHIDVIKKNREDVQGGNGVGGGNQNLPSRGWKA